MFVGHVEGVLCCPEGIALFLAEGYGGDAAGAFDAEFEDGDFGHVEDVGYWASVVDAYYDLESCVMVGDEEEGAEGYGFVSGGVLVLAEDFAVGGFASDEAVGVVGAEERVLLWGRREGVDLCGGDGCKREQEEGYVDESVDGAWDLVLPFEC